MFYSNSDRFKELSGYDIDGVWYPRVTKIVDIKSKPALYYFYAEMNSFAEGEAVKKMSASEGTAIHEAVEKVFKGEIPQVEEKIMPAFNAFLSFINENNIQVDSEYIEKQVVNYDDRYAGTLDALALIDGKFGVLDIKTSQAIYRDYNLQTSAYMGALQKDFDNLQTRWILRIDQNKTCIKCGSILREKGGRKKIKLPWKKITIQTARKIANMNGQLLKEKLNCRNFPTGRMILRRF